MSRDRDLSCNPPWVEFYVISSGWMCGFSKFRQVKEVDWNSELCWQSTTVQRRSLLCCVVEIGQLRASLTSVCIRRHWVESPGCQKNTWTPTITFFLKPLNVRHYDASRIHNAHLPSMGHFGREERRHYCASSWHMSEQRKERQHWCFQYIIDAHLVYHVAKP